MGGWCFWNGGSVVENVHNSVPATQTPAPRVSFVVELKPALFDWAFAFSMGRIIV
jgi:hypothetical protein